VLATVVRCDPPTSAKPGDKAVISADGHLRGWIGGSCSEPLVRREALRALSDGTPRLVKIVPSEAAGASRRRGELTMATTCPSGGALDIFIEPQLPKPLLIVFGDSPAADSLVKLGELTGFRTRPVTQAGLGELAGAGADAWAVVATMGHYDEEAIEAAIAFPELWVALVASRRRSAAVLDGLRSRGVSEAALARVHAPVGRVRGGTQQEIALLALAEVVAARRRHGPAHRGAAAEEAAAIFATDPVCGMAVEIMAGALTTEKEGVTHYFCGPGCRSAFLATAQV
jgi:xanthine dehydrogenase accessory factor